MGGPQQTVGNDTFASGTTRFSVDVRFPADNNNTVKCAEGTAKKRYVRGQARKDGLEQCWGGEGNVKQQQRAALSRVFDVHQLPAFGISPPAAPPSHAHRFDWLPQGQAPPEHASRYSWAPDGQLPPPPLPLFEERHLHDTVSLCPKPLRLQLRGPNATELSTHRIHVKLIAAERAFFGLDATVIREHVDAAHGEDGEGHHGFEEAVPEFEFPPLEEIATYITLVLTMASSSDFVRSHVDPDGYAKAKAKEAWKKEKQLAGAGAELAIKKLLATPLLEVDIGKGIETIEQAERENVNAGLIDKAAEHVEKVIEAYMRQPD